jgi:hypothetical protein
MDFKTATEVIGVIRAERQRRLDRLQGEDPDVFYDQWLFTDEPFVNEMCLMVLVALRHGVERKLVSFAACANAGTTISNSQYRQNLAKQQKLFGGRGGWAHLVATLGLRPSPECERSMETLRLLANCYKHQAGQTPTEQLLAHLSLPPKPPEQLVVGYMSLPESHAFREGLAASVNLPKEADYCTIAEKFVDLANQFVKDAQHGARLARVQVSLAEFGA